jgi:sec-independent protein translocase protein TatB
MLSIPHLIVIFIVALVIFGPEKLPELARNLGKLMAEFRRTTNDLRGTFETHLRDLEREANDRRIDTPRPPAAASAPVATAPSTSSSSESAAASTPNPGTPPENLGAPGTIPASAPHNAAVALGQPPEPTPGSMDHTMMYDDPEELIRQAEAQIARERAGEHENPERVSDGAIGKP